MPRIAIALGASFLGYATHAGFMARLHELGVRPCKIAGASAGAIAAGLYASGLPQERIKAEVLRLRLRLSFVYGTTPLLHQLRSLWWSRHPSFFNPRSAVAHLRGVVGDTRIEDLKAPGLTVALTSIDSHRAILAERGALALAMVASCCVPVLFAPLEFEGALCFDGGVANQVPVDQWLASDDVDIIIAHRVGSPPQARSRCFPGNIAGLSGDAHETNSRQMLHYRQTLAEKAGKRFLLVDTEHARPAMLLRTDLSGYYEIGAARAQEFYDTQLRPLLDA